MGKLKIVNWPSLQSYKDRRPPWIRFHRTLLDNPEYQCMPDHARALLPMLWLLASENSDPTSGIIEQSAKNIAWRLRQSESAVISSIEICIKEGFIEGFQWDIKPRNETVTKPYPNRNETVTTETETETETDKKKIIQKKKKACVSEEMLFELWNEYPNTRPRGSMKEFNQAVLKQIDKGVSYETIQDGIRRYAQNCNAEGTYNRHAHRWISKGEWDADYSTTEAPPKNGIRAEHDRAQERLRRKQSTGFEDTTQSHNSGEGGCKILEDIARAQEANEGI